MPTLVKGYRDPVTGAISQREVEVTQEEYYQAMYGRPPPSSVVTPPPAPKPAPPPEVISYTPEPSLADIEREIAAEEEANWIRIREEQQQAQGTPVTPPPTPISPPPQPISQTPTVKPISIDEGIKNLFGAGYVEPPQKTVEEEIAQTTAAFEREKERIAEKNRLAQIEAQKQFDAEQAIKTVFPEIQVSESTPKTQSITNILSGVLEKEKTQVLKPPTTVAPKPKSITTTSFTTPITTPEPKPYEGTLTGSLIDIAEKAGEEYTKITKESVTPGNILAGILQGTVAEVGMGSAGFVAAVESLGEFVPDEFRPQQVKGKNVPDIGGGFFGSVMESTKETDWLNVLAGEGGYGIKVKPTTTKELDYLASNPLILAGAILGEVATGAALGKILDVVAKPFVTAAKKVVSNIGISKAEEEALYSFSKPIQNKVKELRPFSEDVVFRSPINTKNLVGVEPPKVVPKKVVAKETNFFTDFNKLIQEANLPKADEARGIIKFTYGKAEKGTAVKVGEGTVALTKQVAKEATEKQVEKQISNLFGAGFMIKQAPKQVSKPKAVQRYEQLFKQVSTPETVAKKVQKQQQKVFTVTTPITETKQTSKTVQKPVSITTTLPITVTLPKQVTQTKQKQISMQTPIFKQVTETKQKQETKQKISIINKPISVTTILPKQIVLQKPKQVTQTKQKQISMQTPIFKQVTETKQMSQLKSMQQQNLLFKQVSPTKQVQSQKQQYKQLFGSTYKQQYRQSTVKRSPYLINKSDSKKRKMFGDSYGRKGFVNPLASSRQVLGLKPTKKGVKRRGFF